MKTTFDLPDELVIEVKKAAAERRTTMRALVERGLRRELAAGTDEPEVRRGIEWVTVEGGLPPGLDISDRTELHRWLAEERPDGGD